ncbi:BLUF domain-containing protein [Endozoicomonas sp. Mp262]|uniref:BLUF domain-containing protein n=1 Tax=Endozoicomonas sp. Mp262 TaxID=2919499 RepID=UPI0021DA60A6
MYYIVYTSAAKEMFSEKELDELLEVARRNNTRDGITGMLLYCDGVFMQVLEGSSKDEVMKVYDKIGQDPRHYRVMKLLEGEQDSAQFSDWSMGFKKLDPLMSSKLGFSKFLDLNDNSLTIDQKGSSAWKILSTFRKNNT